MKMRRNKKLNRKGFTLIELLAVIVILAVIMVIASTSVISSMNSSKKKSLQNSAAGAADAFTTAFSEAVLNNQTTFYKITGLMEGTADDTVVSRLTNVETAPLNINDKDYDLPNSYIVYDGSKVNVCFSVQTSSQFYVAAYKSKKDVTIGKSSNSSSTILTGTNLSALNGAKATLASGTMWACSDGTTSWIEGQATSTTTDGE